MQEKVYIICSWCGWENSSLGLRAAMHYALRMDFPTTPGTHERYA